jgi:anti-anti-sigma factor
MTTITVRPELELRSSPVCADRGFALEVVSDGDRCVVHVTGELDLATRNRLFRTCTAGNYPSMVVDISRLTFVDCCGYGGIVASRSVVEADGRTLTVRGAIGEPAQLLNLIAHLEQQSPAAIGVCRDRSRNVPSVLVVSGTPRS